MPKRIIDGEGIWRSSKLRLLPEKLRPLYPWMIPLAMSNGSFECEPEQVWSRCFALNLPSVTLAKTVELLDALAAVGLIERWTAPDGKSWGYWTGIEKPGRLPSPARRGAHEAAGMIPPSRGGEVVENNTDSYGVRPEDSVRSPTRVPEPKPKPKPKPEPKPDSTGEVLELPGWMPQREWLDFVAMRLNIRKPIKTPAQARACIAVLAELRDAGNDPAAVLVRSIAGNWQGLFPLKNGEKNGKPTVAEQTRHNAQIALERAQERDRVRAASAGGPE